MRSAARAHLALLIAARGAHGMLLVDHADREPGESADGADLPPGTMKYPPCICPEHRMGRGKPDSSVRLSADPSGSDAEWLVRGSR